ncbi:MAG: flagellar filament capping protein FliD [Balneolales bacterium]
MISAADIFKQNSPWEPQIQQILQLEGLRRAQFRFDVQVFESQKSALDDIGKAFSSMQTAMNSITDEIDSPFETMKASATSDAISIVSTDDSAKIGNMDIEVGQVARRDTQISAAMDMEATSFSGGTISMDLQIGADTITISVDTAGLNNDEVLEKISEEITSQEDLGVSASRIQVSDTESALSIKSEETGLVNKITIDNFQDDNGESLDLENTLSLISRFADNELDAEFMIDGVSMTRSSNRIENAVDGLTFDIIGETTGEEGISVTRDTSSGRDAIESFIKSFNELNSELRENTRINAETGEMGILNRERSLRNLSMTMRQSVILPVDGNTLADLGIEMAQDGTLSLDDSDKLESLLTEEPGTVDNFFNHEDFGIAQNLKNSVETSLSGNYSLLDTLEERFDTQIDRTNTRIERENVYLERHEESLRAEFNQLQQIIDNGEDQWNQIMNFQSSLGF